MADSLKMGVNIDDAQVQALIRQMPNAVRARLRQLIEGSAIDVQREMVIAAPVGVHGGSGLRGSIRYTLDADGLQATVAPVIAYADDVEKGTPPHWVSVAENTPLRDWAEFKGLNPYALQRSIAKKGTKAHPFVEPTYDKMKPKVEDYVANGIRALARELDDGRV